MKNTFKLPFLAMAISLSLFACKGNKNGGGADSAKVDSSTSVKTSTDTTVKVDTTKATDTTNAKTDTVSKTTTKHTVIKKTITKKD